jgi:DNA-binding NtrC family response regulator
MAQPPAPILFSASPAMREVSDAVRAAATHADGVLILGEPGSGRQTVARAIHASDTTRPGGFVKVDVNSLPSATIERDLLGDARPRLPSAHPSASGSGGQAARRQGRGGVALEEIAESSLLHQAIGGTLFVENLQELPAGTQARLARLLRDGEAYVLGTRRRLDLDVRVIVAGEPSLPAEVDEGRIRPDLFRRCCAVRIDVPPLRQRREDIPDLVAQFLSEIAQRAQAPEKAATQAAVSLLQALPWRGNATELRQVLESVAATATRAIRVEDLLANVHLDPGTTTFVSGTLRQAKRRFERDYIDAVLAQHRGRIPDAARALGIQRTNLYKKLRALNVPVRTPRPPTARGH